MRSDQTRRDAILRLYETHPLHAQCILDRVQERRRDATMHGTLSVWDLAIDDVSQITDQNHVGGVDFVNALASAAEVTENDRVYDLGCGLGGSARVLAVQRQCAVTGLDVSPVRCAQARELNEVVGLGNLVTIQCVDIERMPVPIGCVDVLWAQCSLVHVCNSRALLERWGRALSRRGRVAFEEPYLRRSPQSKRERNRLARVEHTWSASLLTVDEWSAALAAAAARSRIIEDLSQAFETFLCDRLRSCPETQYFPGIEVPGWEDALRLVRDGVIGYLRCVSHVSPAKFSTACSEEFSIDERIGSQYEINQ